MVSDLVSDLLLEVQEEVGALPLLQFTLDQLFQRRSKHQMTLTAYGEIGGVKGAVARHAEATYASLPSEEHRKLTRVLFLRLIAPGATIQETTRRRITRSELLLSDPKGTVIIDEVTRAFPAARLLTTNTVSGEATVEVSHEAVIREWARLSNWLDEAREDVYRQQTISEDATEWARYGRSRDRLYRGTQLKEAKAWARRNTPSADEVAFLRTSTVRQTRFHVSVAAICLLVVLLLIPAGLQFRQIFFPPNPTLVTTLADNEQGSLRQAVFAAKPGSTITFDTHLRGVIKLASNISIYKDLIIRGPGAGNLSITGSGDFNVVIVKKGVTATISDLAFNGTRQTETGMGIIVNDGTLTLTNITVSGNSTLAGAITNDGTLTLTNSTISNNTTSSAYGGGIGNYGGSLKILNSRISGNTAFAGGGIFNNDGPLTLSNSTVSDNSTSKGGDGGGIYNVNSGTLTLDNSTVSGNTAYNGYGGGIDNGYYGRLPSADWNFLNTGGSLTLSNSTISDNTATHGGGILANGDSQANITFCTIYGNAATSEGGGIAIAAYNSNRPGQVKMKNSIVARNHAGPGPDILGTLTSGGYNLIQNSSGMVFTLSKGDRLVHALSHVFAGGTQLHNNGGPTQTLALLSDPQNPALNVIPLSSCQMKEIYDTHSHRYTDQRGMQRPEEKKTACDIGAYES